MPCLASLQLLSDVAALPARRYILGLNLALRALEHPYVEFSALHDAAPQWSVQLNAALRAVRDKRLLLTSEIAWRALFGGLDGSGANERRAIERIAEEHKWPAHRLNGTLAVGSGLAVFARATTIRTLKNASAQWMRTGSVPGSPQHVAVPVKVRTWRAEPAEQRVACHRSVGTVN